MKVTAILLFLVSAVLPAVLSAPIPAHDHPSGTLDVHQEHNHPAHGEHFLVEHKGHATGGVPPPDAPLVDIHRRNPTKGKVKGPAPNPPKITWAHSATASLNKNNFHGKERKQVKDYHKSILKQDMAKHGAHTAIIHHVEHPGGSDPHERLHITASYFDKEGKQIKSPWSLKKEAATGTKTEGHFHVYNEDQKHKTEMPKHWKDALAAAEPARLAKLKAHEDNNARQAKEKEDRIKKQQEASARRIARQKEQADAKRAQREAAVSGSGST